MTAQSREDYISWKMKCPYQERDMQPWWIQVKNDSVYIPPCINIWERRGRGGDDLKDYWKVFLRKELLVAFFPLIKYSIILYLPHCTSSCLV